MAYAFELLASKDGNGHVAPTTAPALKVVTETGGTVGGSVPATLALTLGAPASFGPFTPGVDRTYDASTTANVISTAGDAALTVDGGKLSNGAFTLLEPLQIAFSKSTWSGAGLQRRRDGRASSSTSAPPSRCAPAPTPRR